VRHPDVGTTPVTVPDLDTPALVVDLDVLERNLDAMADATAGAGVALRPHAKTHKCPEVARLQQQRGAVGVSVATVGEAEVFCDDGVDDIFVAYPVWASERRGRRMAGLAERCRLTVGVDSPAAADTLGRASRSSAGPLRVLVEVDSGHHRSGVLPDQAAAVATAAARAGLEVAGVFTFPGHGYGPGGAPEAAARDEATALARARDALEAAGIEVTVVSGGSTPTARATIRHPGPVNELRPGVYAFNDAQQLALGSCTPEQVALTAHATVVSAPAPDRLVLDAGSKVLGADRPSWVGGYGCVVEVPGATVTALSEHHAVVSLDPDAPRPGIGARVRVVPNHCCNAVNLVDELVVARGGVEVDRWAVAARGANT
jgi:D-serine deaminase-like pyridoxal phosphate-dependent protein